MMDLIFSVNKLGKKWRAIDRILSFGCAGLLILYGILSFSIISLQINVLILQVYYFGFAVLMILCELNFKNILTLFGFMGNLFGKGLFIACIGFSMIDNTFNFKLIIAIVFIICGILLIVLFLVPNKCTTSEPHDANKKYEDKK